MKQLTSLNVLFAERELQEMMERRNYCVVDTLLTNVSEFIGRRLGFAVRCDLTRMTVLYTEKGNKVVLYRREEAEMDGKLVRLWSNVWNLKCVSENTFALHSLSPLLTL